MTHKGEIYTEAKAGVAGGTTSYMEMPNTVPQAVTIELLEEKFTRAKEVSLANYSFFFGGTNDNLEEILKLDLRNVCGLKVFQGSSTGNMVVDNIESLEGIFKEYKGLLAIHSENDHIIKANLEEYKKIYGEDIPVKFHPKIRSEEACNDASSRAIAMAKNMAPDCMSCISARQKNWSSSTTLSLWPKNILLPRHASTTCGLLRRTTKPKAT